LTKATIRCIPYDSIEEVGACVFSGAASKGTCFIRKSVLKFSKKAKKTIAIVVAFKNSCIFATAIEIL
jgi:hypothetical protein